jgi:signal transduction histidine kinase
MSMVVSHDDLRASAGLVAGRAGRAVELPDVRGSRDADAVVSHAEGSRLRIALDQLIASRVALAETRARLELAESQLAKARARERRRALASDDTTALRSELIANAAHDLRTPLTVMRGYVESLRSRHDTLSAAKRAEYAEIALRQCDIIDRLVRELLCFAKLDVEGLQLELEALSLGELAFDMVHKFRLEADRRKIKLEVVAPTRELPRVAVDVGLIERALDNLIANAMRHTPAGGTVCLTVGDGGCGVELVVTDTGPGIAPRDLPYVFDRFHRGEGSTGSGLGLAIVRRIVELHGGDIRAECRRGGGARFVVFLPWR